MPLRRYWIEFHPGSNVLALGCGVTARDEVEALATLGRALKGFDIPPIRRVIEDVDVSSLDPDHVLMNIGDPTRPGVWYPAMQGSR